MSGTIDVQRREVEIINYLRARNDPALVSEIYANVCAELGDTVSRPAYYKILNGMVASGKLDEVGGDSKARYTIAPNLHATNRLTLDDVYEAIPFLETTETIARAVEARQYFVEHRTTVLRAAAEALCTEHAVRLFAIWIGEMMTELIANLTTYHAIEEHGNAHNPDDRIFADASLARRIQQQCEIIRDIVYRQLSLPLSAINVRDWEGPDGLKHAQDIDEKCRFEPHLLREELARRIVGVGEDETILGLLTSSPAMREAVKEDVLIGGSDGSFYAGTLGIQTAGGYIEDDSFIITFNNSVAHLRASALLSRQQPGMQYRYAVPIRQEAMDDPSNKGMVLAPFMFPMLSESEYEHMSRAASDVVQMRVDDMLFSGTARNVHSGDMIPAPRVLIRDGTITPQERIYSHYYRPDPYGDIVREGIIRSRNILQRIQAARARKPIYAGAVKSTQNRLFSRFLNWYIARGSRATRGIAIEPGWDISRASFISDIDAMTALLSTLEPRQQRDGFWVSCVVMRQFASLTDYFDPKIVHTRDWFTVLKSKRDRAIEEYEQDGGLLMHHAAQSEDDLRDDPYLYLLDYADYASFYIGHTAGDPPPKIPRYEFMGSYRVEHGVTRDQIREEVQANVSQLVTALLVSGLSADRDHNFLSRTQLVKMIPRVVYDAHEYAKHVGKQFERQYKSIVVARLAERRGQRLDETQITITPIGVRRYLQRIATTMRALPDSMRNEDPDR